MKMFCITHEGRTVYLPFRKSASIAQVKEQVERKEGIPPELQRFTFRGGEVGEEGSLGDYGITHGSTLALDILPMSIDVKLPEGGILGLQIPHTFPVSELKHLVQEAAQREAPGAHYFVSARKQLRNDDDPIGSGVEHGSIVLMRAFDESAADIEVIVATLTGKNYPIKTNPGHTIEMLKLRAQDVIGVPPGEQRLIHRGSQLSDHWTLADYNITDQTTLQLVLRLRGGMMHTSSQGADHGGTHSGAQFVFYLARSGSGEDYEWHRASELTGGKGAREVVEAALLDAHSKGLRPPTGGEGSAGWGRARAWLSKKLPGTGSAAASAHAHGLTVYDQSGAPVEGGSILSSCDGCHGLNSEHQMLTVGCQGAYFVATPRHLESMWEKRTGVLKDSRAYYWKAPPRQFGYPNPSTTPSK